MTIQPVVAAMIGGWEIILILGVLLFFVFGLAILGVVVFLIFRATRKKATTPPPPIPPPTHANHQ